MSQGLADLAAPGRAVYAFNLRGEDRRLSIVLSVELSGRLSVCARHFVCGARLARYKNRGAGAISPNGPRQRPAEGI